MASVKLTGLNKLRTKLRKRPQEVMPLIASALFIEGEVIMQESKKLTPVDLGALRASGLVQPPVSRPNRISVTLGFGGPAAPYALYVHENLTARHNVGQAKYLEQPFRARLQGMSERIAERVERGLT